MAAYRIVHLDAESWITLLWKKAMLVTKFVQKKSGKFGKFLY